MNLFTIGLFHPNTAMTTPSFHKRLLIALLLAWLSGCASVGRDELALQPLPPLDESSHYADSIGETLDWARQWRDARAIGVVDLVLFAHRSVNAAQQNMNRHFSGDTQTHDGWLYRVRSALAAAQQEPALADDALRFVQQELVAESLHLYLSMQQLYQRAERRGFTTEEELSKLSALEQAIARLAGYAPDEFPLALGYNPSLTSVHSQQLALEERRARNRSPDSLRRALLYTWR